MATKTHYVRFYSPGTFVAEESSKRIDSWDTAKAVEMAETITERHGAKPYGFQFTTSITHDPIPDGEGGELKVLPRRVAESGMHYMGGRLLKLHELEAAGDESQRILVSNMRCNDWPICIENTNSYRSTQPFHEQDCIVGPDGKITVRGDDPELVAYRREQMERVEQERAAGVW